MADYNPADFPDPKGAGNRELRDYFAAAALTGMISRLDFHLMNKNTEELNADLMASNAYELADALLKERNKK